MKASICVLVCVLTIAAIPVPIKEARHFGIIQVDANGRVVGFQEKPDNPQCIPGRPNEAFASMGNYIFKGPFLTEVLHADAKNPDSSHDFGKDILPSIYK